MNSPPSCRYRIASDPMTPMSESALAMGCVWTTRLMPQNTAMPAKMKKMSAVIVLLRCQRHHQAGDQQVEDCHREKERPGKTHELVVAETRRRGAHPDKDKQQDPDLGAEPEQRHQYGLQNRNEQRESENSGDAQKDERR